MSFNPRPLVFKLHLYLSVAVGLYIAILGVTGAVLAFHTEIERFGNAALVYVTPAPPRLSFAELGAAVAKAYPDRKVLTYIIGDAPDLSTSVAVAGPTGVTSVFVNPYTGQVLGSRTGGSAVLNVAGTIHRRLVYFEPGRGRLAASFVSWVTVAALFLVISGIWLWWPQMRFRLSSGRGRPFWYDLHATLGIAAAAFLIVLALSGIVIGFGGTSQPMLYALTGSKFEAPPKPPSRPAEGAPQIPADQAFAIGAAAMPGTAPVSLAGPTPQGTYIVGARTPDDRDYEARSAAIVDAYTGEVLYSRTSDTVPAGRRLWNLNRAIHFGVIYGMASQIIMALASLVLAVEVVSGIVMWIKRVPLRSTAPALIAAAAVTAIAVYTVFATG